MTNRTKLIKRCCVPPLKYIMPRKKEAFLIYRTGGEKMWVVSEVMILSLLYCSFPLSFYPRVNHIYLIISWHRSMYFIPLLLEKRIDVREVGVRWLHELGQL